MAEFRDRLLYAIKAREITLVDLEKRTEALGEKVSQTLLSKYINNNVLPRQSKIDVLSRALNVDVAWLFGFSNKMESFRNYNNKEEKAIPLPVIGKIAAGQPILAVENVIDMAFCPESYMQKDLVYFWLKVQGDSMNLEFNDGDYILIQQQPTLENDEIGVIMINDEATVKKYTKAGNVVILEPLSTNLEHKTMFYDLKEFDIRIIGKVIAYQGKI